VLFVPLSVTFYPDNNKGFLRGGIASCQTHALDKHLGSAGRNNPPRTKTRVSYAACVFFFLSSLLYSFFSSVTISSRHSSRRMRFGKGHSPTRNSHRTRFFHPDKYLVRASERANKIEIYFKSTMRKASLRRILHAPDSLDRLFTLP